jgi:hypothetical protein
MTTKPKFPRPQGLDWDELSDARWDLMDNGTCTLPPTHDPDKWIYWLKRHEGFAEVGVKEHTAAALILEGF